MCECDALATAITEATELNYTLVGLEVVNAINSVSREWVPEIITILVFIGLIFLVTLIATSTYVIGACTSFMRRRKQSGDYNYGRGRPRKSHYMRAAADLEEEENSRRREFLLSNDALDRRFD